jgi:hypothetical protein
VGALGEYCKAEVAEVNNYPDYIQHWRNEVERILFMELAFFIQRVKTKTAFDRRTAIDEVVAEYDSTEDFEGSLLAAKRALATRYLKQPHANLKLPDAETSRNGFWLMVSEAVNLALE